MWSLCLSFSTLCPLRGCAQLSALHVQPRHSSEQSPSASYDELRLPVLGQLVGCLILCCAFVQEDKTCRCALSALRHLYRFVLWRSRKATAADLCVSCRSEQ